MTFNKAPQAGAARNDVTRIDQRSRVDSTTVLQELFKLLEDYGPVWYTEDHHNRALAVLMERS